MSTEPIWAPSTSSRSPPSWPLGNTSTVILPPERSSTISLNFTDAMSAKPSGAPEWPTFNVNSGNASTLVPGDVEPMTPRMRSTQAARSGLAS